jgi:hypothetical protein
MAAWRRHDRPLGGSRPIGGRSGRPVARAVQPPPACARPPGARPWSCPSWASRPSSRRRADRERMNVATRRRERRESIEGIRRLLHAARTGSADASASSALRTPPVNRRSASGGSIALQQARRPARRRPLRKPAVGSVMRMDAALRRPRHGPERPEDEPIDDPVCEHASWRDLTAATRFDGSPGDGGSSSRGMTSSDGGAGYDQAVRDACRPAGGHLRRSTAEPGPSSEGRGERRPVPPQASPAGTPGVPAPALHGPRRRRASARRSPAGPSTSGREAHRRSRRDREDPRTEG